MKKLIVLILTLSVLLNIGAVNASEDMESYVERGKVLKVEATPQEDQSFLETYQVTLKILSGEFKGEVVTIEHTLTDSYAYDIPVKAGDKVLLIIDEYIEAGETTYEIHITEYVRDTYVYVVVAIFVALLLLIGRKAGLKTLISLTLTIVLIVKVLLPGMLKGHNPIFLTIIVALLTTVITILLISGINNKSIAAILGILGGILAAGFITFYVGSKVKLTGLSGEEVGMLMFIPQGIDFDFRGLLFSGIMLGSLGAVMDVGISVASSMEEVKRANPLIKTKDLFLSGMNVGRDMMGTMSNTLILAYTGSTIPLLLVFMAYETSLLKIINLDIIASEIIRAFAGTIGLILTIPITAISSSLLNEGKKKVENKGV